MKTRPLGDGELSVLKALWELGKSPVKDVLEHLNAEGKNLAYNTVQTVLVRLVEKELVACDRSAPVHRFKAVVGRERFRRDRVRELVSKIYDGNAGALACQLVKQGRLKDGEIEQLQSMLNELATKKKRSGKSR
ncbi:MAG: hypothetical protein DWQ01_00550 [Planctomycetota bacterium]|nr:MAG: hypothetical protein DWQ01_00550 [Planctomycetota bacterium]